jgi:DNA-binding response OmpR family regulator
MKFKVLIVEDDRSINNMVYTHLVKEGFEVETSFDGIEAYNKISKMSFDLILLDLMLPKLDGMELLKFIREKSLVPVLVLSAKDSDIDKVLGLGFGADDYISKPFSMIELIARVKAAIRRANYTQTMKNKKETHFLHYSDLSIDLHTYLVYKRDQEIKLTSKEFHILKLFMSNPNRVFTKEDIYEFVWNDSYYGDENIINVHMRRLRAKIEDNPSSPQYIKTLWGIGYRLGG